jgi:tRNA uridine 5-carboxymethylaminomethyl modification enzyme
MAYLADLGGIQFKTLNKSKGPAVWSPRAQIDKDLYPLYAYELLFKTNNLVLIQDTVSEILISNDRVEGILTRSNERLLSKAVIFCAGTFLNGVMYTGQNSSPGGRVGEPPALNISDLLISYGFEAGRLKTGTPPRIHADSIDYSKVEPTYGDDVPEPFSYRTPAVKNRLACYLTSTNPETHDVLRTGFDRSPMFTGMIGGVGPRYCPSIEDKINRFAERDYHKIVLEPEGLNTDSVYVNGFSTSLPADVQEKALRQIPGLENSGILRHGYAIEYDFFYPYQLNYSLETKRIEGLYFAGQINGTSGYEEAAAQGLMAGINAVLKIRGEEPFILKRSEAYIGVLIDDLVNKSTEEPYRIFTSLAEYRLLLRQDNADQRLAKYAYKYGLLPEYYYNKVMKKSDKISRYLDELKIMKLPPAVLNPYLESVNESLVEETTDCFNLTKRAGVELSDLVNLYSNYNGNQKDSGLNNELINLIQTEIKYEGYIRRQLKEIEYFNDNEKKRIPAGLDYNRLTSLSNEGREKLNKIRPSSLGQAARIPGVSATDVSIISVYLK